MPYLIFKGAATENVERAMSPRNYEITNEHLQAITRRHFFSRCAAGIGSAALASLLNERLFAATPAVSADNPMAPKKPHFAAKAKRVIYLHMAGAPSSLDLFDYKAKLVEMNGQPCPESL